MPPIEWSIFLSGLALCLGGWTIYWAGLHLTGALAGAGLGLCLAWAGMTMFSPDRIQSSWWLLPIGGVAGFAFGIFIIRGLHRFFFFLAGSTLGMAMGNQFHRWGLQHIIWMGAHPLASSIVSSVGGAALGGMAMVYGSRLIIALTTSVIGAGLTVLAVEEPLALLAAPPLALGSFFFQIGLMRKLAPMRRRLDDESEK